MGEQVRNLQTISAWNFLEWAYGSSILEDVARHMRKSGMSFFDIAQKAAALHARQMSFENTHITPELIGQPITFTYCRGIGQTWLVNGTAIGLDTTSELTLLVRYEDTWERLGTHTYRVPESDFAFSKAYVGTLAQDRVTPDL